MKVRNCQCRNAQRKFQYLLVYLHVDAHKSILKFIEKYCMAVTLANNNFSGFKYVKCIITKFKMYKVSHFGMHAIFIIDKQIQIVY